MQTANATSISAATDDYAERGIDLNEQLIRNKPATFFFWMKGDAMTGVGIYGNDVFVVDRSVKAVNGKVIVSVLNGELMVCVSIKSFPPPSSFPKKTATKPSTWPNSAISPFGEW